MFKVWFKAFVACVACFVILVIFVGLFFGKKNESVAAKLDTETNLVVQELINKHQSEQQSRFIKVVEESKLQGQSVHNDMQLAGIRVERERSVCSILKNKKIKNWLGFVKDVSANSEGNGVLEISLGNNITLKTWNNSLSDMNYNTLIKPNLSFFNKVSALQKGATVVFSGNFFESDEQNSCLKEASVTLRGSVLDPEYIFKFSKVTLIENFEQEELEAIELSKFEEKKYESDTRSILKEAEGKVSEHCRNLSYVECKRLSVMLSQNGQNKEATLLAINLCLDFNDNHTTPGCNLLQFVRDVPRKRQGLLMKLRCAEGSDIACARYAEFNMASQSLTMLKKNFYLLKDLCETKRYAFACSSAGDIASYNNIDATIRADREKMFDLACMLGNEYGCRMSR